ncbi:MAG: glycosyltransferase [Proteobacteria bacterium]|nr:glycosyltransferase [Pseudomonadota bacterium]
MGQGTLSVVIPNYNHAAFLPDSLDALLAQSRAPDEILVIDDGSTDDSAAVVTRYAERHPCVRLVRQRRNRGCPTAVNRGARLARGRYLFVTAADDVVLPGLFAESLALLEEHPQAGVCVSDHTQYRADPHPHVRFTLTDRVLSLPKAGNYFDPDELASLMQGGFNASPAAVFRRDAFLGAGGYPTRCEEYADWINLMIVTFTTGLCYNPRVRAAFRVRPDSWSHRLIGEREKLREKYAHMLRLLGRRRHRHVLPYLARTGAFDEFEHNVSLLLENPRAWSPTSLALHLTPLGREADRFRTRHRRPPVEPLPRPLYWDWPSGPHENREYYDRDFLERRVRALQRRWRARRETVVIYGAGAHTEVLMSHTNLRRSPLLAIAEPVPWLHGQRAFGLPIVSPDRIADLRPDVVLISSLDHERNLLEDLEPLEAEGIALDTIYTEARTAPVRSTCHPEAGRARNPGSARDRKLREGYARCFNRAYLSRALDDLCTRWGRHGRRVVVYGAGDHTAFLFRHTPLAAFELAGVVDADPVRQGAVCFGYRVQGPEAVDRLRPDVVLLSSAAYQEEMAWDLEPWRERGIEIVRLYPTEAAHRPARTQTGSAGRSAPLPAAP